MVTITLPTGAELGAFAPIAYFDHHLDCIHVRTHDRSVTEHRLSEVFTIHECNHRRQFDPVYVGFTIKGVRSLFAAAGIPMLGVHRLVDLIDQLVKRAPGTMAQTAKLLLVQHNSASDLVVDLDKDEQRLAA